jgi:hypothetical protein
LVDRRGFGGVPGRVGSFAWGPLVGSFASRTTRLRGNPMKLFVRQPSPRYRGRTMRSRIQYLIADGLPMSLFNIDCKVVQGDKQLFPCSATRNHQPASSGVTQSTPFWCWCAMLPVRFRSLPWLLHCLGLTLQCESLSDVGGFEPTQLQHWADCYGCRLGRSDDPQVLMILLCR